MEGIAVKVDLRMTDQAQETGKYAMAVPFQCLVFAAKTIGMWFVLEETTAVAFHPQVVASR